MAAGAREGVDDQGARLNWRVGVNHFPLDNYPPPGADLVATLENAGQRSVAASQVGVADIDLDAHAAGDAVDGAGKNVADANCTDGIDRPSRFRDLLHCQGDLGGGEKSVAAIGHE